MVNLSDIQKNLEWVKERIAKTAESAGRMPDQIKLIAVTKNQPLEAMLQASRSGLIDGIGENMVQEAKDKKERWPSDLKLPWHMIGHLQRNKAKLAIQLFDIIQSIDSMDLAAVLEKRLAALKKNMEVLIEVNISGEISKYGVDSKDVSSMAEYILRNCPSLKLTGLMGIGPLTNDRKKIISSFALLRRLKEKTEKDIGLQLHELSMGMSDDFELAIKEGSTMVRIGRAIFGPRVD